MMITKTPRVLNCRRRYAAAPFLHGAGDFLHPLGPLASRQYLPHQHAGHTQGEQRDYGDDDDPGQVGAAHADGFRRQRRDMPEHSTSWKPNGRRCRSGLDEWPGVYARAGRTTNIERFLTNP
jgi:hypothetical protein